MRTTTTIKIPPLGIKIIINLLHAAVISKTKNCAHENNHILKCSLTTRLMFVIDKN